MDTESKLEQVYQDFVEFEEEWKKNLELITTKANEYDKLDHKFKLTCGKGAQEVLQYITKFGLVGDEYETVEVPKCMGDFLDNTFDLEATSLMCTMQDFTESDYFIEYCEIPLEKYPQGWDRLLVSAIENGYTVAKEPLYYVKLPEKNTDDYNAYGLKKYSDGRINVSKYACDDLGKSFNCRLTEQEIKSVDERYWAFAVPVEEEAK